MNTQHRLERYLDEIVTATGLPGSAATEVRRELSQHLFDLHTAIVKDGWSEPDAGERAIEEFGEAGDVGRLIGLSKRSRRSVRFGRVARWVGVAAALAFAAGIGLRAGAGSGDVGGSDAARDVSQPQTQFVASARTVEPEPTLSMVAALPVPSRPDTQPEIDTSGVDPAAPDKPAAQVEVALVRQRSDTLDAGDRKPFELRLRLLFLLIRLRLEGSR